MKYTRFSKVMRTEYLQFITKYLCSMAFYFYLSTKIIMVFITKSYQDLFGVRSYINAYF